jgi:hypothetical protein
MELGFFRRIGKATACKAAGATIEGVPATSVSPKCAALKWFALIAVYAAAGIETASSPKYTSSGVRYSSD